MTNINSNEMVLTNDIYTLKIVPTGKPEVGTGKASAVKFSITKALLNELEKSGHTHILFTYDIGMHRLIAIFSDNNQDKDAVCFVKTTQGGKKEYTTQASATGIFNKLNEYAGVQAKDKFSFRKEEGRFVHIFDQNKIAMPPQQDLFTVGKGYLSKPELDNDDSGSTLVPKIYRTYGIHFLNEKDTKMIKVKIEHKKYTPEIEKNIVSDYVLNQCKINSGFLIIDMGVEPLQEVTLA